MKRGTKERTLRASSTATPRGATCLGNDADGVGLPAKRLRKEPREGRTSRLKGDSNNSAYLAALAAAFEREAWLPPSHRCNAASTAERLTMLALSAACGKEAALAVCSEGLARGATRSEASFREGVRAVWRERFCTHCGVWRGRNKVLSRGSSGSSRAPVMSLSQRTVWCDDDDESSENAGTRVPSNSAAAVEAPAHLASSLQLPLAARQCPLCAALRAPRNSNATPPRKSGVSPRPRRRKRAAHSVRAAARRGSQLADTSLAVGAALPPTDKSSVAAAVSPTRTPRTARVSSMKALRRTPARDSAPRTSAASAATSPVLLSVPSFAAAGAPLQPPTARSVGDRSSGNSRTDRKKIGTGPNKEPQSPVPTSPGSHDFTNVNSSAKSKSSTTPKTPTRAQEQKGQQPRPKSSNPRHSASLRNLGIF